MLLDGQAHRDREDLVGEDGHLVGLAVAVGVFEDLDPVGLVDLAGAVLAVGQAVVQPLGDPDPAPRVDVHVGRVVDHRLGGPERGLEALGRLELLGRLLGADLGHREAEDQARAATPRAAPRANLRREEMERRHHRTPG